MMTSEERITALHTKMNELRQKQERQKTQALGAASAALGLCLLILIFGAGSAQPGGTAGIYSGATMLFANAGGYVPGGPRSLYGGCHYHGGVEKPREQEMGQRILQIGKQGKGG